MGVQEDVLNTPELANVNAIQDGRVYLFGQATTAAASFLCIGYMAKWFYPERFEDLDMKAMHQEYLDRFQDFVYDLNPLGPLGEVAFQIAAQGTGSSEKIGISYVRVVGTPAPMPEPTSALLFAVGALVVGGAWRKKAVA